MTAKLIIEDWAYLPLSVGDPGLESIKRDLTVIPTSYRNEEVEPIRNYSTKRKGYLGLPIHWALDHYPKATVEDRTVMGNEFEHCRMPDWNHPLAPPGQGDFAVSLFKTVADSFACMAVAPTGSGKTVVALGVAAKLGRTTLAIAPSQEIAKQWRQEAMDKLGLNEDSIGWAQQGKCDYEGKSLVVGIIHSIAGRDYGEDFYRAFGTVIWDEVHVCGAATFRKTLGKFPAAYRIALTATPNRKDGCDRVFLDFFGEPRVTAKVKALPLKVEVHPYRRIDPVNHESAIPDAILLNILTKDSYRNHMIAKLVGEKRQEGRHILVIGDRVGHLQDLQTLCLRYGIGEEEMGIFAGFEYETGCKIEEFDGKVSRNREVLWRHKETDLPTPARIRKQISKDIIEIKCGDGVLNVSPKSLLIKKNFQKKITIKADRLKWVKKNAMVIFATYGMMKQGVDIPRLDCGIDVTPRAEAIQVVGRIRRYLPGKPEPVWMTIRDEDFGRFVARTQARIRDYLKSNGKVVYYG